MSRGEESYKWEVKGLTTGDTEEHRVAHRSQHASWSREIFRPLRLPNAVTAIDSVLKNSWARLCKSSTVTASIFSISSSRSWKRSKYISWRARFDMRAVLDSSESIRLPLSWSLERRSSSSGTGLFFRSRNSFTTDRTTFDAEAREVPA